MTRLVRTIRLVRLTRVTNMTSMGMKPRLPVAVRLGRYTLGLLGLLN